jgi:carbonic anhydrase
MLLALLPGVRLAAQEAPACDMCAIGRNQSPVRVEHPLAAAANGPAIGYHAETVLAENHDGKNLQVDYPGDAKSGIVLDGTRYTVREFHFHAPGEHVIGTFKPALEAHFVHAHGSAVAVLGLPIAVGASTHPLLRTLFESIPRAGDPPREIKLFQARSLTFQRGVRVLRYPGSLTTGACAEGVSWMLYDMRPPAVVTVTQADLDRYTAVFPKPYARDPQPLNARVVVRVGDARLEGAH